MGQPSSPGEFLLPVPLCLYRLNPLPCSPSTGILIGEHSAWGSLLFAAKRAATTIQVVQDGNCTLLGGMSKEGAKEALRSGM